MCGRFAQYRIAWEYLEPIGLQLPLLGGVDPEPINRYNVAPRSKVRILHWDQDGLRWDLVPWGWAPFWAKGKRPPAINARGETRSEEHTTELQSRENLVCRLLLEKRK